MAEIDEQLNSLETRIYNLETQENAYKVLRQGFNTLKNQQMPVSKIQWDVAPNRNLKQVLGNLDNMPYSNLREWLEHIAIGGNNNSSSGPVWESISAKIKELIEPESFSIQDEIEIDITETPCLLIVRCPFVLGTNAKIESSSLKIESSPSITFTSCEMEEIEYYQQLDGSGTYYNAYAQTFFAKVTEPGTYTLTFTDIPHYTWGQNVTEDVAESYPEIFTIRGDYSSLEKAQEICFTCEDGDHWEEEQENQQGGLYNYFRLTPQLTPDKQCIYFINLPCVGTAQNKPPRIDIEGSAPTEKIMDTWVEELPKLLYYNSPKNPATLTLVHLDGYTDKSMQCIKYDLK